MPRVEVAAGCSLHYEDHGSGGDAPLLLLAPLGRDHGVWARHIPALSARLRCIAPDARGTGRSDGPPSGYSIGVLAQDAAALLDRLGIEAAYVAGSSMGSAVALELALGRPERVRSLALFSPWAATDEYLRQPFELLAALARSAPRRSYEAAAAWLVLSRAYWDERPDLVRQAIDAAASSPARPSTGALLGHLDAALRHDVADRLHEIRAPTLVLAGDEDRLVPPDYSERVAAAMPGSRFELLRGTGHGFAAERAGEVLDITTRFIDEVEAACATR